MHTVAATAFRTLLVAGLLAGALAGFDPSCTYTSEWTNRDKRLEGTSSPLSGCQQSTLGLSSADNILLGGNGDAEIVGVPAGSGGKGCESGTECMKWCEALCCMAAGCKYAVVKKDTKTTDYVVYKETSNKFYCRLYSSGSLKDSDSQSTCIKEGSSYCDELAYESFKLNASSYQQLVAAAAYPTCPASGRRLLSKRSVIPSASQINSAIAAVFKPFATLKSQATQEKKAGKLKGVIHSSGVCQYAFPRLVVGK